MKIKEIVSQCRRDFIASYVCEHCRVECFADGYDDDNFHRHVIPAMACEACGKTAADNYIPRATKYAAGQEV